MSRIDLLIQNLRMFAHGNMADAVAEMQADNERLRNEIKSLNERNTRLVRARDEARNKVDALKSWQASIEAETGPEPSFELQPATYCQYYKRKCEHLAARLVEARSCERSSEPPCKEADGCPTENAVLRREWRSLTAKLADAQSWQMDTRRLLRSWLDRFGSTNGLSEETRIALAQGSTQPLGELCPRPFSGRPDGFTAQQCVAAGECGCGASQPLYGVWITGGGLPDRWMTDGHSPGNPDWFGSFSDAQLYANERMDVHGRNGFSYTVKPKPLKQTRMRKCGLCGVADIPYGVDWKHWFDGKPMHIKCPSAPLGNSHND